MTAGLKEKVSEGRLPRKCMNGVDEYWAEREVAGSGFNVLRSAGVGKAGAVFFVGTPLQEVLL